MTKKKMSKKEQAALNDRIHERDNDRCIICGAWVPRGEKWHHVLRGAHKEDTEEAGVTLCYSCHTKAHSGGNTQEIRNKCEIYLGNKYKKGRYGNG